MDNSEIKSNVERLELYSDLYPLTLPLRISNFQDEKEYIKFIKNCEKSIRGSIEYKQWKNYLTDILSVNSCSFTNEIMSETSLEIHHHVPSLFCLVKALINKNINEEKEFSTFDICISAIELHFSNLVGYIPLISSLHEKFHNGNLLIPIEKVKGNYRKFIQDYSQHLDDDDLEMINARLNIRLENVGEYLWSKDNYPGMAVNA